jgi:hypothetical protein
MNQTSEIPYRAEPLAAEDHLQPFEDLMIYLREYARERPEVVALTCFGIGFILGWKLKPW